MKGIEKQSILAECRPSGIFDFFENLIRTKKHDFVKEHSNHQLKITDFSLEQGFASIDKANQVGELYNQPIYRIKIRVRD